MAESVVVKPSWYVARGFGKYDSSCEKCGFSRNLQMSPESTEEETILALGEFRKEFLGHQCLATPKEGD